MTGERRAADERLETLERGLEGVGRRLKRLARAWSGLDNEQRFAGFAALGLLFTMFLPWYEKNFVSEGKKIEDSISAFGDVSFVEASIFLVAGGVLLLVLARGEGRRFELPGGDGNVILAAGAWASLLIFYRVFDKPDVSGAGATIGIQWGFLLAFVTAGLVAYSGQRLRQSDRPAAPVPGGDEATVQTAVARPRRRADPATAATRVAGERKAGSGEPKAGAGEPKAGTGESAATRRDGGRGSDRAVTRADAEQLTFDDPAVEEPFDPDRPPRAERLRPGEIPSARDRP